MSIYSLVAGGLIALASSVVSAETKPNILFFFTDDQAYNTLGIYGNEQVKTPNIDRLGRNGVVFDRHYNTTTICMASRANVMSGLFEYKSGCNFQHGPMGTRQWSTSYPMLLKEHGYRTGFAGKFGLSVSDVKNIDKRGTDGLYARQFFDVWLGGKVQTNYETRKNKPMVNYAEKYPHSSRSYGAATIDFMRDSVKQGKPFCMSVFYKAPHTPFTPDPFFDEVYAGQVWKRPSNFGIENGTHLADQARTGRQPGLFSSSYSTEEKYQDTMRKYNQLIYGVDYSIGMILDELKALGIDDNTIIIFSSDNGYSLGAHGFGGKVLPYEEASRAPLIILDPHHPKSGTPRRADGVTGNVDITATILDYAGVAIPSFYDGRSLRPAVEDETVEVRKSLPLIQVFGKESSRCLSVVTKDYKYIYWLYTDAKKDMAPTEELFHIAKDTTEMTNLATNPEYAPKLKEMRGLYAEQLDAWKRGSVDYNGYEEYGELFDPAVSWDRKAALIVEKDSKIQLADLSRFIKKKK